MRGILYSQNRNLMINEIIAGICNALAKEFNCEICTEQSLSRPHFHISCVRSTWKKQLADRYLMKNEFEIRYLPVSETQPASECYEAAGKLNWLLEFIEVNGILLCADDRKSEIVDGKLNYFVNYECLIYKQKQQTAMDSVSSKTNVKG